MVCLHPNRDQALSLVGGGSVQVTGLHRVLPDDEVLVCLPGSAEQCKGVLEGEPVYNGPWTTIRYRIDGAMPKIHDLFKNRWEK